MQIPISIIQLFLLLSAAHGLTRFLRKYLDHLARIDRIVLRLTLGFGILSIIGFTLAALHLLKGYAFYAILAVGNFLNIRDLFQIKQLKFENKSGFWIWLLLAFLITNLFYSLFPPTFYDSMLYHLAVPNYYMIQGGMVPWPTNFNAYLPLNVEMLFLFSMLGNSILLPKLISLASTVLIALLLFNWMRNQNRSYSLLAVMLFCTIPQAGFLASSSKPDMTGMLFMLAALRLFFSFINSRMTRDLVLSGVIWGLAVGSKYIFGFYLIGFFLALLFFKPLPFKRKIVVYAVIAILVFLMMMPWFIKNTVMTGNPLYPYLNSIFKSDHWSESQGESFSKGIRRGGSHAILKYLYYPLELFLKPYKYGITAVYGVLLLLFLPFLLFGRKDAEIRMIQATALLSFILILPFAMVPRYFLPAFLLLSIPVAFGSTSIIQSHRILRRYFPLVLGLLVSINLIMQVSLQERQYQGFAYLTFKLKHRNNPSVKYLYTLPYYRAVEYLNAKMGPEKQVLFVGEDRTFYMKKSFLASSFNDHNLLIDLIRKNKTDRAIIRALRLQGISKILYTDAGLRRLGKISSVYQLNKVQRKRLNGFLSKLAVEFEDRLYKIYALP